MAGLAPQSCPPQTNPASGPSCRRDWEAERSGGPGCQRPVSRAEGCPHGQRGGGGRRDGRNAGSSRRRKGSQEVGAELAGRSRGDGGGPRRPGSDAAPLRGPSLPARRLRDLWPKPAGILQPARRDRLPAHRPTWPTGARWQKLPARPVGGWASALPGRGGRLRRPLEACGSTSGRRPKASSGTPALGKGVEVAQTGWTTGGQRVPLKTPKKTNRWLGGRIQPAPASGSRSR